MGLILPNFCNNGATFSHCGKYRYLLWREWRGSASLENYSWLVEKDEKRGEAGYSEPKSVLWVMLNPSTADAKINDPTIRRCIDFTMRWKYDRCEIVNLFAYRATRPKDLLALGHNDDPVGYRNQYYIQTVCFKAGLIICAWGAHGDHLGQDETVLGWLGNSKRYALGFTKNNQPKHPLYVSADTQLIPMNR